VDPVIRGILLINRASPAAFIAEFADVVSDRLPSTFVGIDLAGDELAYPHVKHFEPVFTAAQRRGLGITVHASEFCDSGHVWRAIDELGASRIGHGLGIVNDAALMDRLLRDNIMVEVSLTSNLALGAVSAKVSHPCLIMVEHGIPVCFNSDVPLHLGSDLPKELRLAGRLLGANIVQDVQARAVKYTFWPAGEDLSEINIRSMSDCTPDIDS
jgi:adenosine deaminase